MEFSASQRRILVPKIAGTHQQIQRSYLLTNRQGNGFRVRHIRSNKLRRCRVHLKRDALVSGLNGDTLAAKPLWLYSIPLKGLPYVTVSPFQCNRYEARSTIPPGF